MTHSGGARSRLERLWPRYARRISSLKRRRLEALGVMERLSKQRAEVWERIDGSYKLFGSAIAHVRAHYPRAVDKHSLLHRLQNRRLQIAVAAARSSRPTAALLLPARSNAPKLTIRTAHRRSSMGTEAAELQTAVTPRAAHSGRAALGGRRPYGSRAFSESAYGPRRSSPEVGRASLGGGFQTAAERRRDFCRSPTSTAGV